MLENLGHQETISVLKAVPAHFTTAFCDLLGLAVRALDEADERGKSGRHGPCRGGTSSGRSHAKHPSSFNPQMAVLKAAVLIISVLSVTDNTLAQSVTGVFVNQCRVRIANKPASKQASPHLDFACGLLRC